jgi:hypothetical protein
LLIRTTIKTTTRGAKGRYLKRLLDHLRLSWQVKAIVTLTDKEWNEINACLDSYGVKHQLCFWHCIEAIKKRLKILRRAPAHYHADEAHAEFDWIDKKFVPVGQSQEINPVS